MSACGKRIGQGRFRRFAQFDVTEEGSVILAAIDVYRLF